MEKAQTTYYPDAVCGYTPLCKPVLTTCDSVLNAFKAMVHDDDFLEKEDMYILDRMKDFLLHEGVSKIPAAKQLLMIVERAVRLFISPIVSHY